MVSAIAPGVMAQTGMESFEILSGIAKETKAEQLILIDALAARSTERLNTTIQLTDTGICPGAGVGNQRKALNEETLGLKVLAIGVPTVVDASVIVSECMEETLQKQGFTDNEIQIFLESIVNNNTKNLFVTPKDIDEQVRWIGGIVSRGINSFFES